jgi:hypothetical protein
VEQGAEVRNQSSEGSEERFWVLGAGKLEVGDRSLRGQRAKSSKLKALSETLSPSSLNPSVPI